MQPTSMHIAAMHTTANPSTFDRVTHAMKGPNYI